MGLERDHESDLREILRRLAAGDTDVEQTVRQLQLFQVARLGDFARLDVGRDLRKGVPEVIYAPHKSDTDIEAIVRRSLVDRGFALVTRLEPDRAQALRRALSTGSVARRAEWQALAEPGGARPGADSSDPPMTSGDALVCSNGLAFDYQERAGTLSVRAATYRSPQELGCVGLLTAGTSDIRVAEEAALVAGHMGCRLERGYDVGVAGLHRLLEPLGRMLESGVDVLLVFAGMEGALPSVVAGLLALPVIGVPTSTGYGLGGDGTAALLSMLQSCSPGLVVVNIDNGVGAGAAAALIARGARSRAVPRDPGD